MLIWKNIQNPSTRRKTLGKTMVAAAQKPKLDSQTLKDALQVRNLDRLAEDKDLFVLLRRAVQAFLDERDGTMRGVLMELSTLLRKLKPEYCEFLETFTEREEPDIDGIEQTTTFPPVEDGALEWIASRAETETISGDTGRQKLSLLVRTEEACAYLQAHNTTEEAQQRLMNRLTRIYKLAYGPFDVPKQNAASGERHPIESLYEAVQDALTGNIRTPSVARGRNLGLFTKAHGHERWLSMLKYSRAGLKLRAQEKTHEIRAMQRQVEETLDGEIAVCARRRRGRPAGK